MQLTHPSNVCSVRATHQTRSSSRIVCASVSPSANRRDILIGAGLSLTVPLILPQASHAESTFKTKKLLKENLSTFQKADQLTDFFKFSSKVLDTYLTPADAPAAVRLALLDAGTYDISAKAGGISGAVIANPSALEPSLKPIVDKLTKAKKDIDAIAARKGAGPISWADLIYMAGRAATLSKWRAIKKEKLGGDAYEGNLATFDNPWDTQLGRLDNNTLGPNKAPPLSASVEEITAYMSTLGAKPGSGGGFLASKPPFWEQPAFLVWTASAPDPDAEEARFAAASPVYAGIKKKYDAMRSGKVLARGDYEIDFARAYDKLTILGANFDPDQYCYDIEILDIKL